MTWDDPLEAPLPPPRPQLPLPPEVADLLATLVGRVVVGVDYDCTDYVCDEDATPLTTVRLTFDSGPVIEFDAFASGYEVDDVGIIVCADPSFRSGDPHK